MEGYRVADTVENPLALDPSLVASQMRRQQLVLHLIISVVSMGVWFPYLLFLVVMGGVRAREAAKEYKVTLGKGRLIVGTPRDNRTVPLDSVVDAVTRGGVLSLTLRVGQPFTVFGVVDTVAASEAILSAREVHLQSLAPRAGVAGTLDTDSLSQPQQNPGARSRSL